MQVTPDNDLTVDKLSDRQILTKIWTSPRQVFKFINDTGYDKFVIPLLVLSGISRSLDRADQKNMGDNSSLWTIIGVVVLLGGLFGWLSVYFYAALINWTGKWLKGQGTTNSILMMFSYAMIPEVIALVLQIPQIVIFGNDYFRSDDNRPQFDITSNFIFWVAVPLEIILGIWTVFLCVIGTSEVQKLPVRKAMLNLLLPIIVIVVPLLIIGLLLKSII